MAIPAEKHYAYVTDRGGQVRVGELTDVTEVQWTRTRSDISDAHVTVSNPGRDCCGLLAGIEAGRHELVIYRGQDRVWEGPITRPVYTGSTVTVNAADVLHYPYRAILKSGYNDSAAPRTLQDRAERILQTELARFEGLTPPVNVLPYLVTYQPGNARQSREILPFQKTVWEELDDLASLGLSYCTVGRSIVLFDTRQNIGQTQPVTDKDFLDDIVVTQYGMELATYSAVTDGEGHYGWVGGADPYYGLWEILETSRPEGVGSDDYEPDREAMREQARLRLAGRNPTPATLRVPAGAALDPRTALTIGDLVPGVRVPVRATLTCRELVQMQRFDKIEVTADRSGEQIKVWMSSAGDGTDVDGLPAGGDN